MVHPEVRGNLSHSARPCVVAHMGTDPCADPLNRYFPTTNAQFLTTPNFQRPTPNNTQSWELGIGSWEWLGVGSWEFNQVLR